MGRVIDRRRVMGKKGDIVNQLKKMGCLLWFPLTYQYKNIDLIGGKVFVNSSGNAPFSYAKEWSEFSYAMYVPVTTDISDLVSEDFPTGDYTLMLSAQRTNNSSPTSNGVYVRLSTAALYTGGVKIGGVSNAVGSENLKDDWVKGEAHNGVVVRIKEGNIRRRYCDNVLVDETTEVLPDIWDYDQFRLVFPPQYTRSNIRNILFFNKALSEAEITKVNKLTDLW